MGRHDPSTSGQSEKVVEVGLPDWDGLGSKYRLGVGRLWSAAAQQRSGANDWPEAGVCSCL